MDADSVRPKGMDLQKLLKMVLELRTEENFLGCDGCNRYDAKL